MMSSSGPGSYEINNKFLKRNPSAVFSTARRLTTTIQNTQGPDPATYVTTTEIDRPRSNSREKNSVRAVFGKAVRFERNRYGHMPGP